MLYSIQSKFGETFGTFEAPETNPPLESHLFAQMLAALSTDSSVIEDVEVAPIATKAPDGTFYTSDRLIINIHDTYIDPEILDQVHAAVGAVSLLHELDSGSI